MNERKGFLIFLIAAFGAIAALMILPFFAYILGAAILAFIMKGPQDFLSNKIGDRPSAALLTIFAILVAVVPLIFAGLAVAQDASGVIDRINTTEVVELQEVEEFIFQYTGQEVDIQASLSEAVREFAATTLGEFSRLVNIVANLGIGLSIMLFLLYYFLKDGRSLVEWVQGISPMPEEIDDRLVSQVSKTTSAVIKGHLFVSIAQALIAGVGLAIFGVPNVIFWTFIMMILGLVPLIGTMFIWLPAAVLLSFTDPVSGILLAIYGFTVVTMSDNILRPLFVDKSADLHPAVIILGVVGGVILIGAPGLFIGPVILGIMKSVLTVYDNNYEHL